MPRKRLPLDHLLQTDHDGARPPLNYTQSSREDRSNERHDVALDAALRLDECEYGVTLHSLSQSGLTLEGAVTLDAGQRCTIAMPGLPPRAIDIIWRQDDRAGACFADLLPRTVLDGLLSRFEIREV